MLIVYKTNGNMLQMRGVHLFKTNTFMLRIGIIGNNALVDEYIAQIMSNEAATFVGYFQGKTHEHQGHEVEQLNEMLDRIDACLILKPCNVSHVITEKVIRAQIPCLIESPFAPSYEDGKLFMNLVHEAQVVAMVSNPDRFNDAFASTVSYFEHPKFIECSRLATLSDENKDLSVVLNLMIYDIDIILSVVKSNVKKIHANGVPVVTNTPDIVNARIEFENGCVANLTASRVSLSHEHKARFFQKDAYISVDYLNRSSSVFELSNSDKVDNNTTIPVDLSEDPPKYFHVHMPASKMSTSEIDHFINTVGAETRDRTLTHSLSALEVAYLLNEKVTENATLLQ